MPQLKGSDLPSHYNETFHQLRSGEIPSSGQRSEIYDFISSAYEDRDYYYAEIERHELELHKLRARVADLEELIHMKTALSASVRKIPNEILSLILHECSRHTSKFSIAEPPVEPHFLDVCHRWRNVALSLPTVFSEVRLDMRAGLYGRRNIDALNSHLKRSGSVPLSVEISIYPIIRQYKPRHHALQLLELVTQQASRWKHLHLQSLAPWNGIFDNSFTSIKSFPSLERFICEFPDIPDAAFLSIIGDSPNLQLLATPIIPVKAHDGATLSSFHNITTLDLRLITNKSCIFKILQYCPQLVSLTYRLHQPIYGVEASQIELQTSETVRYLYIVFSDGEDNPTYDFFIHLIEKLTFPNLKSLSIQHLNEEKKSNANANDVPRWPRQHFAEFLTRSSCALTTLVLRKLSSLSEADAFSLLDSIPTLTDLTIYDHCKCRNQPLISKNFLHSLHSTDYHLSSLGNVPLAPSTSHRRLPLIPNLTKLSFTTTWATFDEQTFVEMVLSRIRPSNFDSAGNNVDLRENNGIDISIDRVRGVQCLQYVHLSVKEEGVSARVRDELKEQLKDAGARFLVE